MKKDVMRKLSKPTVKASITTIAILCASFAHADFQLSPLSVNVTSKGNTATSTTVEKVDTVQTSGFQYTPERTYAGYTEATVAAVHPIGMVGLGINTKSLKYLQAYAALFARYPMQELSLPGDIGEITVGGFLADKLEGNRTLDVYLKQNAVANHLYQNLLAHQALKIPSNKAGEPMKPAFIAKGRLEDLLNHESRTPVLGMTFSKYFTPSLMRYVEVSLTPEDLAMFNRTLALIQSNQTYRNVDISGLTVGDILLAGYSGI